MPEGWTSTCSKALQDLQMVHRHQRPDSVGLLRLRVVEPLSAGERHAVEGRGYVFGEILQQIRN